MIITGLSVNCISFLWVLSENTIDLWQVWAELINHKNKSYMPDI